MKDKVKRGRSIQEVQRALSERKEEDKPDQTEEKGRKKERSGEGWTRF